MFRQGLRALLERVDDLVVVGEASDCFGAIELARELLPEVILLDIHVPGCDIVRTTATIGREIPTTKIVILTGDSNDPNLVYQAIRAGARGYVSQDSQIDDLVEAIHLVAQGQAVLAPQSLTSLVDLITHPKMPAECDRIGDRLTTREHEVLELVSKGITNREIARRLFVSESTVRSHIHNILDKLQLSNRVQAAAFVLMSRDAERAPAGWR
jgi:DNA-binding NarL/FixJ family response regulator